MSYFVIENFLSNFSFVILLISMIFYWIQTGFGWKNQNFGTFTMLVSNCSLLLLLLLRWKESGHFPLSNLYESLMFLSWSCTSIQLLVEILTTQKFLGALTSPTALLTNAFATFSLPIQMQQSSPLVPALQSNWLMMHVTVMILSYAALIFGSLLSMAFLVVTQNLEDSILFNSTINFSSDPKLSTSIGRSADFLNNSGRITDALAPRNNRIQSSDKSLKDEQFFKASSSLIVSKTAEVLASGRSTGVLTPGSTDAFASAQRAGALVPTSQTKIELAKNLDNLSYRILGIGFPFLTIGILSGAVWANEAWGSYWSWDPKETWALLTWLVFAIYLHTRLTKGWQGKKPAIIASLGFVVVWMCFLGVNLIGQGLHSYGWIQK